MAPRQDLHDILKGFIPDSVEKDAQGNVYFQPPATIKLKYPCIIYNRDFIQKQHADGIPYRSKKRYKITIIDADPDSDIPEKVGSLPTCSYDRFFSVDNLNHDVYNLFW